MCEGVAFFRSFKYPTRANFGCPIRYKSPSKFQHELDIIWRKENEREPFVVEEDGDDGGGGAKGVGERVAGEDARGVPVEDKERNERGGDAAGEDRHVPVAEMPGGEGEAGKDDDAHAGLETVIPCEHIVRVGCADDADGDDDQRKEDAEVEFADEREHDGGDAGVDHHERDGNHHCEQYLLVLAQPEAPAEKVVDHTDDERDTDRCDAGEDEERVIFAENERTKRDIDEDEEDGDEHDDESAQLGDLRTPALMEVAADQPHRCRPADPAWEHEKDGGEGEEHQNDE